MVTMMKDEAGIPQTEIGIETAMIGIIVAAIMMIVMTGITIEEEDVHDLLVIERAEAALGLGEWNQLLRDSDRADIY